MKRNTALVLSAISLLAISEAARAGAGWADNTDKAGTPFKQPTFYASSPMGILAAHGPAGSIAPEGTLRDTGTALRKFVDNLPLVDGYVTNANLLKANAPGTPGRHIPMAVKEDVGSAVAAGKVPAGAHSVSFPDADYYEIAVVEYREQLHSDLPPVVTSTNPTTGGVITTGGTTLRGYVQIWTPNLPASVTKTQLWRLDGTPVLDNKGQPVFVVGDKPHYLGPIIDSQSGVPVRLRFDNYLPTGHYDPITKTRGGDVFIPTDFTVPGSGLGPLGAVDPNAPQPFERYTQNRTLIHLHGGDTPWISDGEPHSWITPAGENTPYPVGETTQNVPDMPDPGPGAMTYYYPNNQSSRMEWYHDHSFGATRIDVYAGIVSAFMIHDATEAALKTPGGASVVGNNGNTYNFGGALAGMDEIPLIFEDKTFVPKDIAVEDSKWNTDAWGKYGDLWFPHVYESNQNPNSIDGTNPAGRWDYGPWFWPVFPAPLALPTGEYGNASATQEAFSDTPLINGIAYPNLNVEPKAYRFRLLNASLQRYLSLSFYVAEPLSLAVQGAGSGYSAATTVAIGADDNGQVPTATLQINPIGAPSVTVSSGGSGYSATPTITFVGGGATTPATGHALVVGGVITAITVDTAGAGYTSAPTVSISDATGTGASATASLTGGEITGITLNPAPAGVTYKYTSPPTLTLNDPANTGSGATLLASVNTEVPMIPASLPGSVAASLPTEGNTYNANGTIQYYSGNTYDGRPGGIPDPAAAGPNIIHIGSEGGFLAQPNIIPPTPISYQQLRRIVTVLNVLDHGLYVGPAERADFVVDFSQYAGKTLIFYNDCPAPNPGFDVRVDYYTGDADNTGSGGADVTMPGYGPNTRTIMRVNVAATQFNGAAPAVPYDTTNTGGLLASDLPNAFAASQDVPIVPESWQNAAYGTNYTDNVAHIYAGSVQQPTFTFNTAGNPQSITGFRMDSAGAGYTIAPTVELTGGLDPNNPNAVAATAHAVLDVYGKRIQSVVLDTPGVGYINAPTVTLTGGDGLGASATAITDATQAVFVQPKGIQELFESSYGRMNATFSVELPFTSVLTQTTIPVGYIDPPTDQIADGETQFWKVTHNGVDTHVVHFHLFNVQVINRVAWDGTIVALDPAEYGWKETVKMNPLEDIYVAVKPKSPKQPFGVPQSIRALDPTQPIGAAAGFSQVDPKTGLATTVTNQLFNFDWEYVWHCHILGHEENDFMRPVMFNFGTEQPAPVTNVSYNPSTQTVSWTDPTPVGVAATYTDKSNEQGFLVQRSDDGGRSWPALPATTPQSAAQASLHASQAMSNVTLANATSWVDPIPATARTVYRVLGFNSAGYSPSYVATVAGTGATGVTVGTIDQSVGTPNAPTQFRGTVRAYDQTTGGYPITLTWAATPMPKKGFVIKRQGGFTANGVATPDLSINVPAGTLTYTDTTATEVSMFTYEIRADNGTGTLSPGSLVQIATPYALPPVVTGVTNKVDPSGNAVTINWAMPPATTPDPTNVTASPHVTAFNVVRKDAGGNLTTFSVQQVINPLSGTITLPDTTYTDTAPVPGTSVYTVYAVNGDQNGTAVAPNNGSSTTVTLAAAPAPGMQGAVATVNGPTQITVTWAPAPAGSNVSSFKLSRISNGVTTPVVTPAGVATSFVDTGLTPNTTYSYSVQWLVGGNVGTAQTTAAVTTAVGAPAPVTALAATTQITGQGNGGTTFSNTLTWTPGANDATYVVSRCLATAANANCTNASTVFTTLATGVTAATYKDTVSVAAGSNVATYVYQVQAVNANASQISAGVQTTAVDLVPPAAPTTASSSIAPNAITVNWTASSTAATTNYLIQRSSNNGASWTQVASVAVPALSWTDTSLVVGTTYQYRVYAQIVSGGSSATSVSPSSTTTAVYALDPAPVVATKPNYASPLSVSFNFTETAGTAPAPTSFTVYRNVGAGFVSYGAPLAGTARSFTDSAPVVGVVNQYQIVANNAVGASTASNTVSADVLVPTAPAGVTASETAARVATVSWTAPTQDPLAPAITGYQIWASVNGAAATQVATAAANASSTTIATTLGSTYSITVRAVSAAGSSLDSTAVTVADVLPSVPATPTTTVSAGGSPIAISWAASTVPTGAGAISGYQVFNGTTQIGTTAANATSFSWTGARAGNSYSFNVKASNVSGTTAASASVSVVDTVPSAPSGLTASVNTSNQAVLNWAAPAAVAGQPALTSYTVLNNGNRFATGITGTTYTSAALTAGTTYSFTVVANNTVGASTASAAVTVADATPNRPVSPNVTVSRNGTTDILAVTVATDTVTGTSAPAITSYVVEYSAVAGNFTTGATGYQSVTVAGPGAVNLTVNRGTGFLPSPGTGYVRVTAVNAAGSSQPSQVRTVFLQ